MRVVLYVAKVNSVPSLMLSLEVIKVSYQTQHAAGWAVNNQSHFYKQV